MTRTELLLIKLWEECNEVGQRVAKALQFGLDEVQPGQDLNNAQRIIHEFYDLLAAYEQLHDEGTLSPRVFTVDKTAREWMDRKKAKVEHFLGLSAERGILK